MQRPTEVTEKSNEKYSGAGHTTDTLRQIVQSEYPMISTANLSEAEIFQKYLQEIYGCEADYLETRSTNCGNTTLYTRKGIRT